LGKDLRAALVDVVDERILAHDIIDKCPIRSVSPAEQTPLGELLIAKYQFLKVSDGIVGNPHNRMGAMDYRKQRSD
jgi:hypothetical protein